MILMATTLEGPLISICFDYWSMHLMTAAYRRPRAKTRLNDIRRYRECPGDQIACDPTGNYADKDSCFVETFPSHSGIRFGLHR